MRSVPLMMCLLMTLSPTPAPAQINEPIFVDRTRDFGLDFTHFNGMVGQYYISETLGSGCAFLDYDNDGDLDIYLVQGNWLDKTTKKSPPLPLGDRLFRNDLTIAKDGSRSVHFVDVTASSGIVAQGNGMGVAVADYDNDGWLDLYITNLGANQLWRNNANGTFSDVTAASGTDDKRWGVSAVFLDFDGDRLLDLYVANYIDFNLANHKICPTKYGTDGYCGPSAYADAPDRLFRNLGGGRFEDVTFSSGIDKALGSGLGVIAADFDGDSWLDIYVANDADHNFLWLNQKDGTFRNDALMAGCAVNADGAPEASMGVDAEDFDGDGDIDLFMTHLAGETHTLYLNDGTGLFEDKSQQAGVGMATKPATGFGTAWFDYDNDGWLDLLIANGSVFAIEALLRAKDPYPLHQPNQLFHNRGDGTLQEVSQQAGPAFKLSEVSRGAAFGDIDNDGDTDVLIHNNHGLARILENKLGNKQHWLGIRLLGPDKKQDLVGATVQLLRDGQAPLYRRVKRGASFASSNDARVLFGLGSSSAPVSLKITYPGGISETWSDLKPDRYLTLVQGTGKGANQ